MSIPNEELTAAELSVMEFLWDQPRGAPIREIVLAIYGRHEHSLHAAVKSFLDRLLEKGFVSVDKRAFAHRFSAAVSRQAFVGQELKKLAESHFGGALAPLLLSLTEQVKLSRKDREQLKSLIENIRE